jgi:hypothetical protein
MKAQASLSTTWYKEWFYHRVYRVSSFLSSHPNWVPPTPITCMGVLRLPPFVSRGGTHSFAGEGVGGPNSDNGTHTLVLYVYYNPSTGSTETSHALIRRTITTFATPHIDSLFVGYNGEKMYGAERPGGKVQKKHGGAW